MGFATGVGKDIDKILTQSIGEDRSTEKIQEAQEQASLAEQGADVISSYRGPVSIVSSIPEGDVSYGDIYNLAPNLADDIRKLEQEGTPATTAFRAIQSRIIKMRTQGATDIDIQNDLGFTPEGLAQVKASLEAKDNELLMQLGINKDKAKRSFYYARFFGVDDPKLVYEHFDEFDKRYKNIPSQDRLKKAKDPTLAAQQIAYEKWVENNKLSSENRRFVNSINAYAKTDKVYATVVRPFLSNAFRVLDVIEGTIEKDMNTQWSLMAEALEENDTSKLEWATTQFVSAGASTAIYALSYFGIRALLMGAGAMLGPIGITLANVASLAVPVVLETLTDSRDVYREIYNKTGNDDLAMRMATRNFIVEGAITAATDKLGIFAPRGGQPFLSRFIKSAMAESTQEFLQEITSTAYSQNIPFTSKEAIKNGLLAFAFSFPSAGLIGAATTLRTSARDTADPTILAKLDDEIMAELDGEEKVDMPEITTEQVNEIIKTAPTKEEIIDFKSAITDVIKEYSPSIETEGQSIDTIVNQIATDEFVKQANDTLKYVNIKQTLDKSKIKPLLKSYLENKPIDPTYKKLFDIQLFGAKKSGLEDITIGYINKQSKKRALANSIKALQTRKEEAISNGDKEAVKEINNQLNRVLSIALASRDVASKINKINKNISKISKVVSGRETSTLSPNIARPLGRIARAFNEAKNTKRDINVRARFIQSGKDAVALLKDAYQDLFVDYSPAQIISAIEKGSMEELTYGELDAFHKFLRDANRVGRVEKEEIRANVLAKANRAIADTVSRLYHPTKIIDGLKNIAKERGVTTKELTQYVKEKTGIKLSTNKLIEAIKQGETDDTKPILDAVGEKLKLKTDEALLDRIIQYAGIPGGRGNFAGKLKDALSWTINYMRLGEYITGSENSPLAKALGEDVNKATEAYNAGTDKRTKWIKRLIEQTYGKIENLAEKITINGVTNTREAFIAMYLYSRQPEGFRALVEDNGYSPEFVNSLAEHLSEKDKQFADTLSKELMSHFEDIANATFIRTGKVITPEEYYFRMLRLSSRAIVEGTYIDDPFVGLIEPDKAIDGKRASIEKSRTQSAKPRSPLSLDLLGIYLSTIELQERIKAYSEPVAVMNVILNNDTFKNAVTAAYGPQMISTLARYRDITLNPNIMYDKGAIASTLRKLRHFRALGVLVGNAVSVMRQFPSIVLTLPYCNARGVSVAVSKMMSNPIATWKFVMELSPTVRYRTFNLVSREAKSAIQYSDKNYKRWIAKFEMLGMSPQAAVDAAAVTLGWLSMYESAKLTMSEEKAIKYANMNIVKTQPQGEAVYLNRLRTIGGPGGEFIRNFALFTNQLTQNFNIMVNDIPNAFREGNHALATKLIASQLVANAFIIAVGMEIKDLGEFAWQMLANLIKAVPLLGPVMSSAISGYNFRPSYSGLDVFYDVGYIIEAMKDKDNEKMMKGIKNLFYNNGPLPGVAIKRIQKFMDTEDLADLIGYKKAQ